VDFNEYDLACEDLDKGSPIPSAPLAYYSLAMGGESGEVQNEVKKIYRDDGGVITPARHNALIGELGDLLWYASRVARLAGTTLDAVAKYNINKLQHRRAMKHGVFAGGQRNG
jgi:NTP pyrophosphatase (non-canonical NTP hydrolase)